MNTLDSTPWPPGIGRPDAPTSLQADPPAWRKANGPTTWLVLVTALLALLFAAPPVRAQQTPPGCTGSGLGINLFTSSPDVHIGDTIRYSVNVFNGIAGSPRVVCDAIDIVAGIVTPDGLTNFITLRRTALSNGEADFYPDVVSYVVRAQDVRPDATLRATAFDDGTILQNDTPSRGGGDQGVNTEVSLPCIGINVTCLGSIGESGAVRFSGSVTNCGNNTLVGVTLTSLEDNGSFRLVFTNNILRGEVVAFTGSFVPVNPCAFDTVTLTATGVDQFTSFPRTVTASDSATCGAVLTPGILVTQACPVGPVSPGQLLVYTGTVRNTGNVTLTNVTVTSDRPAGTVVFTVATLAPGVTADYTGSYPAPADCSTTSGVVARGTSVCGVPVSSAATATCAIVTTPLIAVTTVCAAEVAAPGGLQGYSGTVRNTGDITLKNVVVRSDRPAANTTVFTVATLAPGASANFTGTYTVPLLDACAVTTTVVASGQDNCTDVAVSSTAVVTCGVTTAPQLAVSLNCPAVPVATGGLITFTGTVSNPGNVTLNNVTVVNAQASPSTVLTVPSLAPGASMNFTASFTAPADACAVTASVNASGSDACTTLVVSATRSATCALVTVPRLVITQECPAGTIAPGALLTYTGTVRNTGDVTVTNVVVLNSRGGTTPVFTLATLAPGVTANFTGSFTAPADACTIASTSTVSGTSVCGLPVTSSVTSTCTILTTPLIVVTAVCSTNVVAPGGAVGYSGTVRNTGNVTLNNVTVVSDRPAANTTVFTVATLAPGASANFTGTYTAPASFPAGSCGVTATLVATGRDLCTDQSVTSTAAANCTITTAPQLAVSLNCPVVPVATGGLITFTGTVSNPGNVTLNNVTVVNAQASPTTVLTVASLAPGASADFTASFTTLADACDVTASVTASGSDNCTSLVVSATRSATCTLVTAPRIVVTQECPAEPGSPGGLFTYGGTVRNAGNVTLLNVVVTDDRNAGSGVATTTLWVDDQLPEGAVESTAGGDSWNFVSSSPAPFSGATAHQSAIATGLHQHAFQAATAVLPVGTGDLLVAHVYLDPANPPRQVMLQWNDGTWSHRAYWGANLLGLGEPGTDSLRHMGPLPVTGQWVRLEVPASQVGLENRVLNGMAFTLFDGRATWDAAGKSSTANSEPVFTAARLAPGETASFTGSFTLPVTAACAITTTLTASGADQCTGVGVTAFTSSTCPLVTTPALEVTQTCPAAPALQGSLLTFGGTVRNIGNITLTNVVVLNSRSGSTPVLVLASLAPGASAEFTGSYLVPVNCCTVSSTATATGADICLGRVVADTATSTCLVISSPQIAVTKLCPLLPVGPGDLLEYTGTVSNTGNITLTDVFVVNNRSGADAPVIGPLTLAPGESADFTGAYLYQADFCGTDTVTARGLSICDVPVTSSLTTTCPTLPTRPGIEVTKNCPLLPPRLGGQYTFTGTVRNTGNVTLVDVFVVNSQPAPNTPVIGPITLAPGASRDFSATFTAPLDCCEITETIIATGHDLCTDATVTDRASTACPILTVPRIVVVETCPTTPVPVGGLFTFGGTVSNTGDVNLTNVMVFSTRTGGLRVKVLGPAELAPGESAQFSGSYTVAAGADPTTDIIEATGMDTCLARTVIAQANCAGPIDLSVPPVLRSITLVAGVATLVWDSTAGLTYTLQCKGNAQDPIWIDIPGNVTATGATASKTDVVGPSLRRFYRVIVVE